jgi:hypothetical protein
MHAGVRGPEPFVSYHQHMPRRPRPNAIASLGGEALIPRGPLPASTRATRRGSQFQMHPIFSSTAAVAIERERSHASTLCWCLAHLCGWPPPKARAAPARFGHAHRCPPFVDADHLVLLHCTDTLFAQREKGRKSKAAAAPPPFLSLSLPS